MIKRFTFQIDNVETEGDLGPLSSNASRQLNIFRHDCHSLSVDGAQVGVLEQSDEIRLGGLLKGHHGGGLESEIGLEILGNFPDQALERELPDQQFGRLLVATDLS